MILIKDLLITEVGRPNFHDLRFASCREINRVIIRVFSRDVILGGEIPFVERENVKNIQKT